MLETSKACFQSMLETVLPKTRYERVNSNLHYCRLGMSTSTSAERQWFKLDLIPMIHLTVYQSWECMRLVLYIGTKYSTLCLVKPFHNTFVYALMLALLKLNSTWIFNTDIMWRKHISITGDVTSGPVMKLVVVQISPRPTSRHSMNCFRLSGK